MSPDTIDILQTRIVRKIILFSLVAAIFIEILLAKIIVDNYYSLFKFPWNTILIVLVVIALLVYYYLRRWSKTVKHIIDLVAPISILLAFIGILSAILYTPSIGSLFILAAYYLEILVGKSMKEDLDKIDRKGSFVFFLGITLFITPLLLVLVNSMFAVIPLIGNSLKILGLLLLAIKVAN